MKIVFAGTPPFAATILAGLAARREFEILRVLTQPAKPKGRGLKSESSAVEHFARERGIEIATPSKNEVAGVISDCDCLVTAAYGIIVPPNALTVPRLGALNVHASLLPRWRGPAPVQRAIESGDTVTGITIFKLDAGIDSGPILQMMELDIGPAETAPELLDRLAALAAEILPPTLLELDAKHLIPVPQKDERATRAPKLKKEEGRLDWSLDAGTIYRKFRAFFPWPGVTIEDLKFIDVRPAMDHGVPGEIISRDPFIVACGGGALELRKVQRPGGKVVSGADYARGARL